MSCLALLLLTLVAYRSAGSLGFTCYDDNDYVTENPHVLSGLNRDNVAWALTATHAANWHPLTWVSLQLDSRVFGGEAYGYHVTNVLLHALAASLLFLAWRRMTGAVWQSWLTAALFAVHPEHVESVAWIAERKDVLGAALWMLTLLAYLHYARSPTWLNYAAVTGVFALGLTAKPMLVTLPFILALLDGWPLNRTNADGNPSPLDGFRNARLLREKLPWFALAAAASAMTIYAQSCGGTVAAVEAIPLGMRIQNAVASVGNYVFATVFPVNLAVFYPHPLQACPGWKLAAASLFVAGASFWAWRERHRHPYLLSGWLWFLISLMPVIGIVQVGSQAMADRYSYLPSIGLYVAAIWTASYWASPRAWRLAAGAAVASCVVLTHAQLQHWKNGISLWRHSIEVTGPNPIAENALGGELLEAGRFDEAVTHLRQAIALGANYADAYENLGLALRKSGRWREAESAYRRAIQIAPRDALARNNLGFLLIKRGRLGEAEKELELAIGLQPSLHLALANYGECLQRQGRNRESVASLRNAVRLEPNDASYRLNLALALEDAGFLHESVEQFDWASRLNPRWPQLTFGLAWRRATSADPSERDSFLALRYARQACRGEFAERADALDILAAAYASDGQYEQAIAVATRALARAGLPPEFARQVKQRIALYRRHLPFRAPAASDVVSAEPQEKPPGN